MSPSWLERLTLVVHPHRAVLERRPFRGETVRQASTVAAAAPGEAAWQPALAAALALLDTRGAKGGSLRIVIADHFVRYALLPWSDTLCSPGARRELGHALLKSTLGEKANALEITVDRPAFGRKGLAAGIDGDLLATLRAAAKSRRLRLSSIQPRLIAELAVREKEVGNGWFASIDRDWLTLAGLRGGEVVSLHNHRLSFTDPGLLTVELGGLLAAGRADVPERRLFIAHGDVHAPSSVADWDTTSRPYHVTGRAGAHA